MNTHSHSQQSDEFLPHDDFDDDDNDLAVEPPMRVTLQAGIAWVATRDAAFTSAFEATTYNRKMYQLILEGGSLGKYRGGAGVLDPNSGRNHGRQDNGMGTKIRATRQF